jgi:hypothetical protein
LTTLFLLAAVGPGATAATHTWSGPASPCGSTVQGCIDGASAGDIVRIATNTPILENLTIDKSLTLRAAAGFSPLLDGTRAISILNPSPRASIIVVEGLTFTQGMIRASQQSENPFDVSLRSLTFRDVPLTGIEISTGTQPLYGPCTFSITDNELTLVRQNSFSQKTAIKIFNEDAVSVRGVIRGNRIDHYAGGQMGAIGLYNIRHNLEVDVIGNDIRGSNYNNGVMAFQYGSGTSKFRYLDNLVVGEKAQAGATGSLVVYVTRGASDCEIVNNTVADGDDGIRVSGVADSLSGVVANNIVSNMAILGMSLDPQAEERNNLIHNSEMFEFVPGSGTLLQDPVFVAPSNYRLRSASPARNAGDDASVPGDLLVDLDGLPRRIGHVDMGAYESTVTVSSPPWVAGPYRLHPNFPNPFNPTTTIHYDIPDRQRVRLGVFDAGGRLVRWLVAGTAEDAGTHRVVWDGRNAAGTAMSSGVYFYRLEAGTFTDSQRMVLAR